MSGAPTRFAALSRGQAVLVALALAALVAWLEWGALSAAADPSNRPVPAHTDVEMYRTIVEHMRAGDSYYDAAESELRQHSYPLRPVFNWRQPTCAWLLSRLPSAAWAKAVLATLAAATVLLTYRWVALRGGRLRALIACVLTALTLTTWAMGELLYFHELWAGYLIALMLASYGAGWWPLAVASGLAALAFREFALLPCAVALLFALQRRRRAEVAAWIVGLAVYFALMALHAAEVSSRVGSGDAVRSWIAFGGSPFVVSTAHWNTFLASLPTWAIALLVPLSLLGLIAWRDRAALRAALIAGGFLGAFSIIGHPFNYYWGLLVTPLLTWGWLWAPDALRDLARAARRP